MTHPRRLQTGLRSTLPIPLSPSPHHLLRVPLRPLRLCGKLFLHPSSFSAFTPLSLIQGTPNLSHLTPQKIPKFTHPSQKLTIQPLSKRHDSASIPPPPQIHNPLNPSLLDKIQNPKSKIQNQNLLPLSNFFPYPQNFLAAAPEPLLSSLEIYECANFLPP